MRERETEREREREVDDDDDSIHNQSAVPMIAAGLLLLLPQLQRHAFLLTGP